jgi:hypothetical protein
MGFSFVQQLEVALIGSVRGGRGRYREVLSARRCTANARDASQIECF